MAIELSTDEMSMFSKHSLDIREKVGIRFEVGSGASFSSDEVSMSSTILRLNCGIRKHK
jgi:hypothetical protein